MAMNKFLIVTAVLLLSTACSEDREPASPTLDIEAGKSVAQTNCAGCHGLDGAGKTAEIPNLAGQSSDYLVDAMHAYREDRRHHAALKDLIAGFSEAEIRNIAGYFASLPPVQPPPEVPIAGDAVYQEGADFAAVCIDCHGERGVSATPGVPSLAGQQPAYLIMATQEYADGSRGHTGKAEMLKGLDQVDIEKMAMFFASQLPSLREPPTFGDPGTGEPLTAACGSCHGARGVSHDPMVPSLAGQEPHYLVSAIMAYRSHERSHEDMITDKSDEDIENIAAFYSVQRAGVAMDRGESVDELAAKCDRCHGPLAGQTTMVVPNLNGQSREYLVRVMRQYRDNDRGSSMMHKMSSSYSDEMIESIATFYANRPAD